MENAGRWRCASTRVTAGLDHPAIAAWEADRSHRTSVVHHYPLVFSDLLTLHL